MRSSNPKSNRGVIRRGAESRAARDISAESGASRGSGAVPGASARTSGAFPLKSDARSYWRTMAILAVISAVAAAGLLAYGNPMPFGSEGFWLLAERRLNAVVAMAIVAVCHGLATVAFQTVANNRIITPSIMGFESLYTAIHTTTIFLFGSAGLLAARNFSMFLFQIAVMVVFSLVLYGWLLTGAKADMHATLLIGVILGAGLGSVTTFMQRVLTPSEFDILTARLFGSVNNAKVEYYAVAIPLVAIVAVLLLLASRKLNIMSLGRDVTNNLGLHYGRLTIYVLILVTILIATSTALVGPMTFLGFLVATLSYQFARTYDHRYVLPMAVLMAFAVLSTAYFILNHVFYAQGAVSIIIELVGGSVFLIVLLRKGRL